MLQPALSEFDLYLLAEGTHYRAYEKLGAHLTERGGQSRRALCRLGAECEAGICDRRVQRLESRKQIA